MRNTLTIRQHNSKQQISESKYDLLTFLPTDEMLTVSTAYQKGYEWSFDVGRFSPSEIIQVTISLVRRKGYKIGCARMRWFNRKEQDRGVYKPLT